MGRTKSSTPRRPGARCPIAPGIGGRVVPSSRPPQVPPRRRCKRPFRPSENHASACRYHPELWTGGESSKYVGFLRKSSEPEDQLVNSEHGQGLRRFWDCCGAETEDAPGCVFGPHEGF